MLLLLSLFERQLLLLLLLHFQLYSDSNELGGNVRTLGIQSGEVVEEGAVKIDIPVSKIIFFYDLVPR